MNLFLACGLIFLLALLASWQLGRLRFPAVTSYLLLGILIGPYVLRLVPANLIKATDLVGYFVLSLIAFSLGENFFWRDFRQIGKKVISISCSEVACAVLLVTLGLLLIGRPISEAIVFGGIAAATAPMATVMVIREYRAKGHFTTTLLDIVAIDDAWGIIAFAITVAIAKLLTFPSNVDNPLILATAEMFREIFGALIRANFRGLVVHFISISAWTHNFAHLYPGFYPGYYRGKLTS
jgi:Kef-type K+ transport system membrane component KefB